MTDKLTSREAFAQFQRSASERWDALWQGEKLVVSVQVDSSSVAKGALQVLAACREVFRGTDAIVREVSGNGAMWMEPAVEIKRPGEPPIVYGWIEPGDVTSLLAGELRDRAVGVRGPNGFAGIPPLSEHPFFQHQHRIVMEEFGVIEPDSIEDAIARGAYGALAKVLFEMTAEEAIAEVTASGLRGRGGAGFPAGIKWESGRKARNRPKFVVVNSHEGEPNVYKDRRIHEGDPHKILEGMLISSVVCGADRAYNYIGGEYPLGIRRFRKAVADAEQLGLIGENILGTGRDVEVRVGTGGGAYICGEGSALMYSVMGVRGQPRTKPPRSVEEGLWKRPTILNNTETLAAVPAIINNGGEWFSQIGTATSAGTKMMTVQGPLKHVGLVETPMGVTLRTLIDGVWGGMREGHQFRGVQTGGVSAGPLTAEQLDYAVDFDSMTEVGGMLGSGGFVVFDQHVCPVDFARYLTAFNRVESCAKCTPCHRGNPALVEILDRIRLGGGSREDLSLMERTSKHIIDLSLCGLGQVAPMPLLGMMKMYPQDFLDHIENHVCAAGACPIATPVVLATAAD
ncbi:MAG: NADH-quinone oxidoreductase subunit F [Chloroflexota bacterium]|nr:NADH-quinone oxidoreductase subunit F [Chloroflexia bacterium]MDQ3227464.1 NADH-quinone oxidoreductase subunit F [Chloroflexota bacterium]